MSELDLTKVSLLEDRDLFRREAEELRDALAGAHQRFAQLLALTEEAQNKVTQLIEERKQFFERIDDLRRHNVLLMDRNKALEKEVARLKRSQA